MREYKLDILYTSYNLESHCTKIFKHTLMNKQYSPRLQHKTETIFQELSQYMLPVLLTSIVV